MEHGISMCFSACEPWYFYYTCYTMQLYCNTKMYGTCTSGTEIEQKIPIFILQHFSLLVLNDKSASISKHSC